MRIEEGFVANGTAVAVGKTMKSRSLLSLVGLVSLSFLAVACSSSDSASGAFPAGTNEETPSSDGDSRSGDPTPSTPGGDEGFGESGPSGPGTSSGSAGSAASPPATDPADPSEPGEAVPPSTQASLTAGDWDDNANFGLFTKYQSGFTDQGALFDCADRVLVRVSTPGGRPVGGVTLDVRSDGQSVATIAAGTDGRAIVCPHRDGVSGALSIVATSSLGGGSATATAPTEPITNTWELSLTLPTDPPQTDKLDLAFVVDATGSMGDEMSYLTKEIQGISSEIANRFPQLDTRYSLVVYRDQGDAYVSRTFDFRDLTTFRDALSIQSADGGGDTPEAMEVGLAEMNKLAWRPGHVARVSFLIADAPPHDADLQKAIGSSHDARHAGIRVYPVAASGVDDTAERVMRISGELTLGRYIFLTNDSGIGGDHAEPHIPCFEVSTLARVVRRAIASEVLGSRALPETGDVIRSVGAPVDGVCTLADGSKAYL
jgi:hypothetical protein